MRLWVFFKSHGKMLIFCSQPNQVQTSCSNQLPMVCIFNICCSFQYFCSDIYICLLCLPLSSQSRTWATAHLLFHSQSMQNIVYDQIHSCAAKMSTGIHKWFYGIAFPAPVCPLSLYYLLIPQDSLFSSPEILGFSYPP